MRVAKAKKFIIISLAVTFLMLTLFYFETLYSFPQSLMLVKDKEYTYDFNTPISVGISVDKKGILKLNGSEIKDESCSINLKAPVKVESNQTGIFNLQLRLFGRIPLKTVKVNVIPETYVIPCGDAIGVKIYTKGILVIGTSNVTAVNGKEYKPSKDSGIEEGDIILSANSINLEKIDQLTDVVAKSNGMPIELKVKRESQTKNVLISPVKSSNDKKYKLGLWVRDSTSGIGTLTFYDPKTLKFGALGHGIMDVDTQTLLNVNKGDILESSVISVKKGKKGEPGELKGIFLNEQYKKGEVYENNQFGIYGRIVDKDGFNSKSIMPVALRDEVKEGPASILSNIDGRKIEAFDIEIQKVTRRNYNDSKNMVIKIIDPRLLNTTGGIVQGMSGSPIIQNGKLIGAVTHVFVNDPTRGYGIFAELMVQSCNNIK